jgi:RNA polymerase sigma-70 factor (ECF subfamily)
LTAESLVAAAVAVKGGAVSNVTVAWLIGIARHKLVDHWRRRERESRNLALLAGPVLDDPWDEVIEAGRAHEVLALLPATQRIALALRYLDGFPVAEVAARIDRTLHATETLLVRSRAAFRRIYLEGNAADDD